MNSIHAPSGQPFQEQAGGASREGPHPLRIGIIAGSGPEAGIDLWSKILVANRAALGNCFRGDIDSPPVVIFSEPVLGLSMDLAKNTDAVWEALRAAVLDIVAHVDVFTIACNTLHYYSPRIRELAGDTVFLDVSDVARAYMRRNPASSVGLMGATPVAALDEWSPYFGLHREVGFETPADLGRLHGLIHDIKLAGGDNEDIRSRFSAIVTGMRAPTVFLACTELPLVNTSVEGKTLVDINRLLAEELVRHSLGTAEERNGRIAARAEK